MIVAQRRGGEALDRPLADAPPRPRRHPLERLRPHGGHHSGDPSTHHRRGPSGEAIPGYRLRVVDGELWIGGDAVARGYHGAPAKTAERFRDELGQRAGTAPVTASVEPTTTDLLPWPPRRAGEGARAARKPAEVEVTPRRWRRSRGRGARADGRPWPLYRGDGRPTRCGSSSRRGSPAAMVLGAFVVLPGRGSSRRQESIMPPPRPGADDGRRHARGRRRGLLEGL